MKAERRDALDLAPLRTALVPHAVLVAARRIALGDEAGFASAGQNHGSLLRRRASGAARIAARVLLAELGADPSAPLARAASGAALWPNGIIGSLAHDDEFAVAAAARRGRLVGVGIDIEPAEPLPEDVVELVLSREEQSEAQDDGVAQRLVFVAKEAVYKAIHPLDGTPLDFPDIEIRLAEKTATLRDGRRLELILFAGERLIAVALATAGRAIPDS